MIPTLPSCMVIKPVTIINETLSSFDTKKQDDLPKHIYRMNKKYYALKKHDKKKYKKALRDTIAEALNDLIEINATINHLKLMEELLYMQTPINRNDDGIAILICKKSKIEVPIDDSDWHHLNRMTWYVDNGYIENSIVGRLHRYLLKPKENEIIDHINNNKFDNRRSNLRIVSHSVNNHNMKKRDSCTSQFKGVYFDKSRNKYTAKIQINHEVEFLGRFDSEMEAHEAYTNRQKIVYT